MAEPMSSGEIEDVLSSIRRLVSDDMRPPVRSPVATEAGKLILTPALRVVADESPLITPASPITQVVAQLGAAVAERNEAWELETGDAAPMHLDVPDDAAWTDFIPDADAAPDEVDDVVAFHSVRDSAVHTEFDPVERTAPPEVAAWAQHDDEDFDEERRPLSGTIEPDQAWADATEAEVIAGLEQAVVDRLAPDRNDERFAEDTESKEFSDSFDDQEMVFNEDVLRELVRDLIREELQGTLGERITRNIRKLVRVEIARAMSVQDYQ